jgi:predicted nucleic acid-binding protein
VSDREAVSNASALIALVQIGRLDLLSHLFSRVVIPPEVARETAPSLAVRPAWIVTVALQRPLDPRLLAVTLDPGERETIGLAMELAAPWVVLDERRARRAAEALGLPVVGTVGLLIRAKRRGLLQAVRPSLDALIASGFFVGPGLYRSALAAVGENV